MGNIHLNTTYKNQYRFPIAIGSVLALSYSLSIVAFLVLPSEKLTVEKKLVKESTYTSFDFANAFIDKPPPPPPPPSKVVHQKKPEPKIEVIAPPPPPPPPIEEVVVIKEEPPVSSFLTVVAIFDMGKGRGFISMQERGTKETMILSVGQEYKGAKLMRISPLFAIFVEKGIEFRLDLSKSAVATTRIEPKVDLPPSAPIPQPIQITQTGNKIKVEKNLLETYTKNTDKIWRDISIKEHLVNGKIDGFKIDKIKKNSNFEKLGVQAGDIISAVNGTELKSYDDAMNMYKKLKNSNNLNMKIKRGNQEMELKYDIQ